MLYPSVLLQCVGATMDVELLGYTTTVQDTRLLLLMLLDNLDIRPPSIVQFQGTSLLLLTMLWTTWIYDHSPCPVPSCCCCYSQHRDRALGCCAANTHLRPGIRMILLLTRDSHSSRMMTDCASPIPPHTQGPDAA